MATRLTKPVTRVTDVRDPVYGKQLVIQIEGGVVRVRAVRTRRWFTVPIQEIWRIGYRAAATRAAS